MGYGEACIQSLNHFKCPNLFHIINIINRVLSEGSFVPIKTESLQSGTSITVQAPIRLL